MHAAVHSAMHPSVHTALHLPLCTEARSIHGNSENHNEVMLVAHHILVVGKESKQDN